jgi:hypothetical protein
MKADAIIIRNVFFMDPVLFNVIVGAVYYTAGRLKGCNSGYAVKPDSLAVLCLASLGSGEGEL